MNRILPFLIVTALTIPVFAQAPPSAQSPPPPAGPVKTGVVPKGSDNAITTLTGRADFLANCAPKPVAPSKAGGAQLGSCTKIAHSFRLLLVD